MLENANILSTASKKVILIFLIFIGLIAVFFIVAYFKLQNIVMYKELLQKEFYKATGKYLDYGEIYISFPYITITNIAVSEVKESLTIDSLNNSHNNLSDVQIKPDILSKESIAEKNKINLRASIDKIELKPDLWKLVFGKFIVDSLYIGSSTVYLSEYKIQNSSDQYQDNNKLIQSNSNKIENSVLVDSVNESQKNDSSQNKNKTLDQLLSSIYEANKIPVNFLNINSLYINYTSSTSPLEISIKLDNLKFIKNFILNFTQANANINLLDSISSVLIIKSSNDKVSASISTKDINFDNLKKNVKFHDFQENEIVANILDLISELALEKIEANFHKSLNETSAIVNVQAFLKDNKVLVMTGDISNNLPVSGNIKISLNDIEINKILQIATKNKLFDQKAISTLKISNDKVALDTVLNVKDGKINSIDTSILQNNLKVSYSNVSLSLNFQKQKPILISFIPSENIIRWPSAEIEVDKTKIIASGKVELEKALKLESDLEVMIDVNSIYKSITELLPKAQININPKGYGKFNGNLKLDRYEFKLNGGLELANITVENEITNEAIILDKCKVIFENFGTKKGKLTIATFVASIPRSKLQAVISGDITGFEKLNFNIFYNLNGQMEEVQNLFKTLFAANIPIIAKLQTKGRIKLDGSFQGFLNEPKIKYSFDLADSFLSAPEHNINIQHIKLVGNGDINTLNISTFTAKLDKSDIKISGKLNNFFKPNVDFQILLNNFDVEKFLNILSNNFKTLPNGLTADGFANIQIQTTGNINDLKFKGKANLNNINFYHPAILRKLSNIFGEIDIDNNGIVAKKIKANWGSSTINLTGKISDWTAFYLDFLYEINPLDLTDIGKFFLYDTAFSIKSSGTAEGRLVGPINKFILSGLTKLPRGEFLASNKKGSEPYKFPFSEFESVVKYTDGLLELDRIKTNLFSGLINATGSIRLLSSPISFTLSANGHKIKVEEFLSANTKYKDILTGKIDLKFYGTGNTNGLNTLNGFWSFRLIDGTYNAPPIIDRLFKLLNADNLTKGVISDFQAYFDVVSGYMNSKETLAKSNIGSLGFIGKVGLDTSLQGTLNVVLHASAGDYSPTIKQLIGSNKAISFPAEIDGTLLTPRINLKLDKLIAKKLEEETKKAISDIVNPAINNIKKEAKAKIIEIFQNDTLKSNNGSKNNASDTTIINSSNATDSQNVSEKSSVDDLMQKVEDEINKSKQKLEKKLQDLGKKVKIKLKF